MSDSGITERPDAAPLDDVADHVDEARRRARAVLSGEAHLGDVDDWRQAIVSARDGVMVTWLIWVATRAVEVSIQAQRFESVGVILVAAGLGISLYLGIATGIATRLRLRHYERELERERVEIRDAPEHEREEVRALYAAKGFREPLLSQVTDTLCEDDDRLLKVMMEEELGLFIQHINHPLLVGLWNGVGAAVGALILAAPVCVQPAEQVRIWMPGAAAALLAILGIASARATVRSAIPVVASWLAVAGVAGGVTYFMAALLAGQA